MKRIFILAVAGTLLVSSAAGYVAANSDGDPPRQEIGAGGVVCTKDEGGKMNCFVPPMPTPQE